MNLLNKNFTVNMYDQGVAVNAHGQADALDSRIHFFQPRNFSVRAAYFTGKKNPAWEAGLYGLLLLSRVRFVRQRRGFAGYYYYYLSVIFYFL